MHEYTDVGFEVVGNVAVVEMRRPPHNFFDVALMDALAQLFEDIDEDASLRAIVLAAQGTAFCAGADFNTPGGPSRDIYPAAARLFATRKPIIAAIQGPAVGGGFGLALVADFRVAAPEARFSANFVKLGIHPGFGLTHTLPRLIGMQKASLLMYTGRRLNGEQALAWGLVDELVDQSDLREGALKLAGEIAEAAPLAVISTRATLRHGLADAYRTQVRHESDEQTKLLATADAREGMAAVAERRPGRFIGA
ncbi:enoyl-CoA hydratase/isomerase family protein [Sphingosinicella soli]|uniref:Enoyl-CoA hydratase/carnithine racemase n=1 Tax=Sphingosinicella soli TaxID=333708 RepID=A0A7W7B216_9SPHN|nr:enoyl-CoA hydratase/isomerase family protein [Sphingosinicella soli]MBB4632578.1 enoyl-CoA hydratase/carnithine racemase [Sphingosinicella soli]